MVVRRETCTIERVQLIENNDRQPQAITHLGRRDFRLHPDKHVEIRRFGPWPKAFDKEVDVTSVCRSSI